MLNYIKTKCFKNGDFRLKTIAVIFIIWGIFNLMNGFLIFNHDLFFQPDPSDWLYRIILGVDRLGAGFCSIGLGIYLWKYDNEIVVWYKKEIEE